jgi:hypothetical protein
LGLSGMQPGPPVVPLLAVLLGLVAFEKASET